MSASVRAAAGSDLAGRVLDVGFGSRGADDIRPGLGEGQGNTAADPFSGAGHDCDLIREFEPVEDHFENSWAARPETSGRSR